MPETVARHPGERSGGRIYVDIGKSRTAAIAVEVAAACVCCSSNCRAEYVVLDDSTTAPEAGANPVLRRGSRRLMEITNAYMEKMRGIRGGDVGSRTGAKDELRIELDRGLATSSGSP